MFDERTSFAHAKYCSRHISIYVVMFFEIFLNIRQTNEIVTKYKTMNATKHNRLNTNLTKLNYL